MRRRSLSSAVRVAPRFATPGSRLRAVTRLACGPRSRARRPTGGPGEAAPTGQASHTGSSNGGAPWPPLQCHLRRRQSQCSSGAMCVTCVDWLRGRCLQTVTAVPSRFDEAAGSRWHSPRCESGSRPCMARRANAGQGDTDAGHELGNDPPQRAERARRGRGAGRAGTHARARGVRAPRSGRARDDPAAQRRAGLRGPAAGDPARGDDRARVGSRRARHDPSADGTLSAPGLP